MGVFSELKGWSGSLLRIERVEWESSQNWRDEVLVNSELKGKSGSSLLRIERVEWKEVQTEMME